MRFGSRYNAENDSEAQLHIGEYLRGDEGDCAEHCIWGVSVSGTGTVSDEWYCDYSTNIQHSR
jgi:hypothetical protein